MRTPKLARATRAAAQPVPAIVRLWLYRIIVPMGGHHKLVSEHGIDLEYLTSALGMKLAPYWQDKGAASKQVLACLRDAYAEAESELARVQAPRVLKRNISRLARLLGLSNIDCRLLEFAVLIHTERVLDDSADWLGPLTSVKAMHAMATLLQLPEAKIRHVFSTEGVLVRSGLLTIDRTGSALLRCKLTLLSDQFADSMTCNDVEPLMLLRDVVTPAGPAQLGLQDYAHLEQQVSLLKVYLAQALRQRRRGVNILLYGAPGTGKTELSKALARDAGCELFEIASQDSEGDPISGGARLRAFRAAQCFLSQRPALVLFDEVEDVFDDGEFKMRRPASHRSKAWINHTLEHNVVPAFWLSNSIGCIDPAFIRRFDVVIELPVPPQAQREKIIADVCADMLDQDVIRAVSEVECLAPAVVARAASVVRCVQESGAGKLDVEQAFRQLVSSTLAAQGHPPLRPHDPARLPAHYDPGFINADSELAGLVQGLQRAGSARLCLYGPPGTGKTAFGRWLASQLLLRLHMARACDLLSKWVGGTEKNIATAFRAAQVNGAMLMIDEVDSFLADRRGAQRSWEVTAVNEMLTQMESFTGIFVASTNLMDTLDPAALRRFDIKVGLDYLRPDQAESLLRRVCALLGCDIPQEYALQRLRAVPHLAPGDFAVIERQHRFRPFTRCDDVVAALLKEAAARQQRARMGFV